MNAFVLPSECSVNSVANSSCARSNAVIAAHAAAALPASQRRDARALEGRAEAGDEGGAGEKAFFQAVEEFGEAAAVNAQGREDAADRGAPEDVAEIMELFATRSKPAMDAAKTGNIQRPRRVTGQHDRQPGGRGGVRAREAGPNCDYGASVASR